MKKWILFLMTFFSINTASAVDMQKMIQAAGTDAYALSVPLLLAAYDESLKDYAQVAPKLEKALLELKQKDPAQAAWLYGRLVMAQKIMHQSTRLSLAELHSLLGARSTPDNVMKAWAYAYVASFDHANYQRYKNKMRSLSASLLKDSHLRQSDRAWVSVMVLYAAGVAHDKVLYKETMRQLLTLTHAKTCAEALKQGIPEKDFYYWANAISYVSAVKMADTKVAQDLAKILDQSKSETVDMALAKGFIRQAKLVSGR